MSAEPYMSYIALSVGDASSHSLDLPDLDWHVVAGDQRYYGAPTIGYNPLPQNLLDAIARRRQNEPQHEVLLPLRHSAIRAMRSPLHGRERGRVQIKDLDALWEQLEPILHFIPLSNYDYRILQTPQERRNGLRPERIELFKRYFVNDESALRLLRVVLKDSVMFERARQEALQNWDVISQLNPVYQGEFSREAWGGVSDINGFYLFGEKHWRAAKDL